MNNLTEQEAFNIADFINSYLFTAIKQDGMDDMEWVTIMVSAYKKLSSYSDYNNPYANETEEDGPKDFSYISFTPKFDEPKEDESYDNPWLNVFWYLASNPLFMGEYDAENENGQFMYGIKTVMEYIAEKAGKTESFRSIFNGNIKRSCEKAGKF